MWALLLLVIFSISYTIGTMVGVSNDSNGGEANIYQDQELMEKEIKKMEHNDLKIALNQVLKNDFKNSLLKEGQFRKIDNLESKIDFVSQKEESLDFEIYFSDDGTVGLYLKRILIADLYRGILFDNNQVNDLTEDYKIRLFNTPKETFSSIKEFLTAENQTKYPVQTVGLMTFASQIKNSQIEQELKELSYELSTRPVEVLFPSIKNSKNEEELNLALSTTPEMMVPIVAYIIYIEKESEPILAIERTIDAISSQKSELIRGRILGEFNLKFPDYKERLSEQLTDRGIVI